MRKYLKFILMAIFVFSSLFFMNITVKANKVASDGSFTVNGKNVNINDETYKSQNPDLSKTVKEICFYVATDKENKENEADYDTKTLFIYTDGTARIGWNYIFGETCKAKTSDNKCADGYDSTPGLKNWGKNSKGVKSGLKDTDDAAKYYEKSETCPSFLGQYRPDWKNFFYLSASSKASGKNRVKTLTNAESGSKFFYYGAFDDTNFTTDITCQYSEEENGTARFNVEFSNAGKAKADLIEIYETETKSGEWRKILGINVDANFTSSKYLNAIKKNMCPKTLDAYFTETSILDGIRVFECKGWGCAYIKIYGDTSVAENKRKNKDLEVFYCIGDNCSDEDICLVYDDYYGQSDDKADCESSDMTINSVLKQYKEYKNANNEDGKKQCLNQFNKLKSEINSYCVSVLNTLDYVEGNCLDKCLKLAQDIASAESEYGLRTGVADEKCNIGRALLNMIYNVLKWAKYIAPVLVIILSILDFIKALASQNDEDMKKAQGKFIKRLIIAAILFLLPLIINFMLKTFGLFSSKCDITDLFS